MKEKITELLKCSYVFDYKCYCVFFMVMSQKKKLRNKSRFGKRIYLLITPGCDLIIEKSILIYD